MATIYRDKNKDKVWRKDFGFRIRDLAAGSSKYRNRDIDCWNMYNEHQDDTEFEYLTKIGDYNLPARIRNVGKQRPKINLLVSLQTRRIFDFDVMIVDRDSLMKKFSDRLNFLLDDLELRIERQWRMVNGQLRKVQQQHQQIQQFLQQEPQNEQQAQQQQQLQTVLPQLEQEMEEIEGSLENFQYYTKEELEKTKSIKSTSDIGKKEIVAEKRLKHLIAILKIHNKSVKNFINQTVTGKQYYYVDYIHGSKYPVFESIDSLKVFYPNSGDNEMIQDGSWVMIEDVMTYDAIIKEYGEKLNEDEKEQLKKSFESSAAEGGSFVAAPNHGAVLSEGVYTGTSETSTGGIRRQRIWYKDDRKIYRKKSPNKYKEGAFFTHFIDEGKGILNEKNFYFKNGYYFNRKNPSEFYSAEYFETYNEEKGEDIEILYIQDRYKMVVIDNTIVIDYGKDIVQPRSIDDWYKVQLPVVGYTYNSVTHRPYSLIWSTKDLQKLYKIVSFHRELMLAIGGARGNIMDISQKPKDMSRDEWEYQKKMGNWYIQTVDATGRKISSGFNQFPSYDASVSQAIQYIDNILVSIDNEIGETMGISRPRLGQQVPTDKVGTNQQAQQMSELITEILYYEHDFIESQALSMLLNIDAQYCLNDEAIFELIYPDFKREMVRIPKGFLGNMDFSIMARDISKNQKSIEELKQLALRMNERGSLPFENLFEIWTVDSLAELKSKLEYFSKRNSELQQQQQQAGIEGQKELMKFKTDLDNEYKQFFDQQKMQLEKYIADLDAQLGKAKVEIEQMKVNVQKYKVDTDKELGLLDIQAEDKTESALIDSQNRQTAINAQLKAMELKMNSILKYLQIKTQAKKDEMAHVEGIGKMNMDMMKGRAGTKEHLND